MRTGTCLPYLHTLRYEPHKVSSSFTLSSLHITAKIPPLPIHENRIKQCFPSFISHIQCNKKIMLAFSEKVWYNSNQKKRTYVRIFKSYITPHYGKEGYYGILYLFYFISYTFFNIVRDRFRSYRHSRSCLGGNIFRRRLIYKIYCTQLIPI